MTNSLLSLFAFSFFFYFRQSRKIVRSEQWRKIEWRGKEKDWWHFACGVAERRMEVKVAKFMGFGFSLPFLFTLRISFIRKVWRRRRLRRRCYKLTKASIKRAMIECWLKLLIPIAREEENLLSAQRLIKNWWKEFFFEFLDVFYRLEKNFCLFLVFFSACVTDRTWFWARFTLVTFFVMSVGFIFYKSSIR